jgi:CheY-like chemotaxis protein
MGFDLLGPLRHGDWAGMRHLDTRNGGAPQLARDERHNKLIMVVDDDPEFRRDICGFLEDEGYRTIAAWNGREAFGLLLASAETPSLIILDLVMQTLDGREFRRRQLAHPRFAHVPVIVVSGTPDAESIISPLGAAGFLGKPLDADGLAAEVERVLGEDTAP